MDFYAAIHHAKFPFLVFIQKLVCLEKYLSNFLVETNKYEPIHTERKTVLQISFKQRKLLLVIRTSYRKLCSGMFIQFFSYFQVMYSSHLRKYLSLTNIFFRFHLMMQSLFYLLICPLFNSKLVKVVSEGLHCCGSCVTEWHQPLKQSWSPGK